MQYTYATFWETEGLFGLLNDARACAARDAEHDIIDSVRAKKMKAGTTSGETLATESAKRIWEYLHYAVENASFLGPISERPFEKHMKNKKNADQHKKCTENKDDKKND